MREGATKLKPQSLDNVYQKPQKKIFFAERKVFCWVSRLGKLSDRRREMSQQGKEEMEEIGRKIVFAWQG
jgi:hypothetical protein